MQAIEQLGMNPKDIKYVIVGGVANAVWGEPRTTRDIDLKVHIGGRTAAQFEALVAGRFRLIPRAPGVSPLIVSAEIFHSVAADFLITIPGYEDVMIGRAIPIAFQEMTLPVCSPEDLIIQKIIADRSKDWADVEGILVEQKAKLDQAYLERWLKEFAEVLERPDWLIRYKGLLDELDAG